MYFSSLFANNMEQDPAVWSGLIVFVSMAKVFWSVFGKAADEVFLTSKYWQDKG